MKFKQLALLVALLIASCLLSFSLFAQPTTTGLICHFKFDGNATNSGPLNVTANPVSTTYTTNNANAANKALQFGGALTSYIDFVDNGNLDFTGTNNFTISFSFFFNGSTTSGLIDNCLNYGGWGIWLWSTVAGTWNLQFNYKNNSVGSAAATNFTTGIWHHVAAVRNNGTISLYIDGTLRLSATEGTTAPTYPINMIAGAMAYGSFSPPRYNPFGGKIDEIRVYNRALTTAEIRGLTPYSLPLKMGDFTAVKKDNSIQLNWETLIEQNTSHFDIERSTDGITFTPIGRVAAAGNSSDKRSYTWIDANPANGTNFYRLKMADTDGTFTQSRIIAVQNKYSIATLQVFPNPADNVIQVQVSSNQPYNARILIHDATGKTVHQQWTSVRPGQNTIPLPVVQLAKGLYHITVEHAGERSSTSFIKR
ncbi:MAG: T9SS type A sorting domain-containing protein [Bacteroidetes bacterium]|nr:T9SS type A sorting domain-containing protein [Bacteroidota bacterium]